MDDQEFQSFLQSLSGLGTTAKNKETSNVERGAFGLPLAKQPVKKQEMPSLTDSPTGKIPVVKQLTQFGVGLGSEIGKAGIGLGQTFLKGANVVSNLMGNEKNQYNPIIQKMEELKTGIFEDPYKKELGTFAGKAGQLAGDVAVFAEGNTPIAKGQQYLSGATKGLNVSNKIINYGLKKTAQIAPEAIGMGGIQYAVSGGDAKEAGTVGVVSGLLSGLTHVGADVFKTLIPQTVKESVAKIFVPRGKIKLGGTENITDDAVGALQTIKNLSPEIKVVDKDGIEKAFVPEKATLLEMPQVLLQAKDKIYQAYSELATKAGDVGASFGQKDFNSVIADLSKYEGKGYTQAYTNKAKQIQEALNRYGTQNSKDGMFYFKDTPPSEIQTLIEAINKDVNPLSDKAGAEVSLEISRKLREILDDKIANATGGEYQQLRNAYGQLKSIEPTVINEFKKALRGQGIQADIIDKIATVDTITGILSGNPAGVARGVSWEAVKIAWRKALGKEANLQRAFKIMGKAEKENSALVQRIYANPSETETFKAGEQAVKDFKEIPNKEGGFIKIPDFAKNEKGTEIAQKYFPEFDIVDADSSTFQIRKDNIGSISGQIDENGIITKVSVEKFNSGERSKLFSGKNIEEKVNKYLDIDKIDETKINDIPEYGMSHRPSKTGAIGSDISSNGEFMPEDIYQHPEWYSDMKSKSSIESFGAIKRMKGKPDMEITIYRASPKNELNNGDWVTLSKNYAKEHAEAQSTDGEKFLVNKFKVKAKDIQFAGDDINEFGYYPVKDFKEIPNKEGGFINPEEIVKSLDDAKSPKINSSLREGQPEIGQTYNTGLVARERFDIPNLKKISFGGSDRDVYDLGNDKVLKIAKSSRGLDQNASSADYYAEDVGLTPKTYEIGENYVVKEKVLPPDANTKKMVKELSKETGVIRNNPKEAQKVYEILNKYGYNGDELMNYGELLWGDLKAIRNWGTTLEGKPIMLDEGTLNGDLITNSISKTQGESRNINFNDPEFKKIYNLSRSAKKKFGDIDKKTMYGAGVVGTGGVISKESK